MKLVEKELQQYKLKISADLIVDEDSLPVEPEYRSLTYEIDESNTDKKSIQRIVDEVSEEFDTIKNMKIVETLSTGEEPIDSFNPTGSLTLTITFTADEKPSDEDVKDLSTIIMDEYVDHNKAWVTGEITVDVDSYDPYDGEYVGKQETDEYSDYVDITYTNLFVELTSM